MNLLSGIAAIALSILLAAPAPPLAQSEEPGQQEPVAPSPQPQEQPAAPAPAAERPGAPVTLTLGEFAIRVAVGLKLPAPVTGFTPEGAAWGLLQKGIRLRADLTSPLTEADAVSILNGLGYKVRTETPSRVMSAERAGILLETFISPAK